MGAGRLPRRRRARAHGHRRPGRRGAGDGPMGDRCRLLGAPLVAAVRAAADPARGSRSIGSWRAQSQCSRSGSSSSARRSAGCCARRKAAAGRRGRVARAAHASRQRGHDARGGEVPAAGRRERVDGRPTERGGPPPEVPGGPTVSGAVPTSNGCRAAPWYVSVGRPISRFFAPLLLCAQMLGYRMSRGNRRRSMLLGSSSAWCSCSSA